MDYAYKYPHPAVTTDCVVFGYDGVRLNVLLVERGNDPFKGCWAFPGGFLEIDEDAPEGAMRELKEETGIEISHLEQLGAFTAPGRDPRERVISIAFFSLVRIDETAAVAGDDAASVRWWRIDKLPELAFDHKAIFDKALERLSHFIKLRTGDFVASDFSYEEMDAIYYATL